ncbi:hypothetical protein [Rhizobium sp. Root482]|uniref:hypothetical protein n=1 Tax=Rhizobium sp. Root482 TaxID=1736543 RepID=UPI0006F87BB3|nr:hypothetical protein [Rhizobium sp. Root482]KQY14582.1 hypothetical protein ASD31_10045 [Rhizobium sp. Root482]
MQIDIRRPWSFFVFLAAAFSGVISGPASATQAPEGTGGIMAPGPDVEAAVQSEYDGVVKKGTREAYERFIRRHPDHPLARKARAVIDGGTLR